MATEKKLIPQLRHFTFSLTMACNLKCKHCFVNAGIPLKWEVGTNDVISVINQAIELGARSFSFTGGEVFLRRDLLEIIQFVKRKGCTIAFETNGTLLTLDLLQKLKDIDPNIFFAVSLDGIKSETHDHFRGVPGSFNLTMKALQNLRKLGFSFQVITVLNTMNLEEIPQITKFVLEELESAHRLLIMAELGRAAANRDLILTPAAIHAFLHNFFFEEMRKQQKLYGNAKRLHVDLPIALIPPDLKVAPICNWGYGLMGMSPDGAIGLCERISGAPGLIGGYVSKNTLREIWQSPFFEMLRQIGPSNLKGICGNCLAASICRGRCRSAAYYQFKDLYAPDPICQAFYEAGLFPRYAMIDPTIECHYASEVGEN
ncbi:MAG: radical SAM protein [Candidatus Methanomethylicaceae archaeon]